MSNALALLVLVCACQAAWAHPRSPLTGFAMSSGINAPANQLQSAGIRENLDAQPGAWVMSRPVVIAGALALVLQSALIAALLVQRRRRNRVEDALRQNQERYSMATAAGAVGVWDWNFETDEVYVDPTLKAILGFEDAEITNRAADWGSRVHLQDMTTVTAQVKACIDGSAPEYEVEHRMQHKDGSLRWFLSRGTLLRRADGTPHRMIGTKVDITERKRAEGAIRENEAALRASTREIQHLAGSLITARDAERKRLARDLHDDVSQQLAALAISLSALKRQAEAVMPDAELQASVGSIQQRTVALAKSIRDLTHDLHPDVLKHAGLTAALAAHCDSVPLGSLNELRCVAEGDVDSIDAETALSLYRIAQEALHNVLKHSRARQAEVRVVRTGDSTELMVSDDGEGFDISEARRRKGLGLVNISERVRLSGGTVAIMTELGKGTRLRVQVPVGQPAITAARTEPSYTAASA